MMSCSFVTAAQAESYFEHTKDYYTKNQTNFDRWHGTLAEAYGLKGELSKEQFDEVLDSINKAGRKRAGLDCTFSAPKSVSLAMAKDEQTRLEMITSHQAAVKRAADKIEMELLQTRSNGKTFLSRNAIIAEFLHETARPTEKNNFVPDLDLHSHCIIMNETTADGKDLSQDFGRINTREIIKEMGLVYRQELAKELQAKGYELEVTDSRQGFFEIKGFDRETVMEYSSRRQEILETAQEHGITDMQKANQFSRNKKEAGTKEKEEVLEQTRKDLFESGKIKIEKKERTVDNDRQATDGNRRQIRLYENEERQRSLAISDGNESNRALEEFAGKPSLSELPRFGVDAESRRTNLLLSQGVLNRLAKFQSDKVRSHYMQCEEKRERIERIDRIAADTLQKLSKEKYAFTIPEAKQRIMAAGVLEGITADEARDAMERAELVKLGQIERDGEKTKDVYVTTKENIDIEKAVLDRVQNGKGIIAEKVLTMEESRAALNKVESKAMRAGKTDFEISKGEQGEAVHHILVSSDKYIAVDGLAGTGKTAMMERLKWIADEKGIEIKGVCFTGKAADGLQADSGIKSTTIHSFLNKLEKGERTEEEKKAYGREMSDPINRAIDTAARKATEYRQKLAGEKQEGIKQEWDFSSVQKCQGREIWAVDEAGLVDMHLMNQLQKAAEARGAQVLFLGDPDQLPPVGAGEPMRMMEEKGMATAHLYDIRRQKKDTELLQAVRESVKGDHIKTFEALEAKGNYREVEDKAARMNDIKAEMTAAPVEEYGKNLLLVSTNADRKAYNKAIRAEYVERGELEKGNSYKITVHDGEKDRTEKRDFAENERIIFTANDKRLGVMNGTMATIEKIDGQEITAKTDGGERVTWNIDKYNSIDHAYAVTNYKAQGMTVDKVVADMNTKGAAQTRNALYVDISRARHNAVVYTDSKERLEKQTKDFAQKVTSKDFEKRLEAMRERGGITNNDRYHAPQDKGKELERALKQIEQHTQAPAIVRTWEKNIEAKREAEAARVRAEQERERQRAAEIAKREAAKAKEQERAKAAEQAARKASAKVKVNVKEKAPEITFTR